jgi:hypothetical protein
MRAVVVFALMGHTSVAPVRASTQRVRSVPHNPNTGDNMTNTDLSRRAPLVDSDGQDPYEAKILTSTETRRSTKTSEMWLAVATFATIVIAGYFSDALSVDRAWLFATIIMSAYIVSRGFAKVGSREPAARSVDVRR